MRFKVLAAGTVCLAAAVSSAQVPAGGEFRVNGQTASDQFDPSAAAAASGDFVIVWTSLVTAPSQ